MRRTKGRALLKQEEERGKRPMVPKVAKQGSAGDNFPRPAAQDQTPSFPVRAPAKVSKADPKGHSDALKQEENKGMVIPEVSKGAGDRQDQRLRTRTSRPAPARCQRQTQGPCALEAGREQRRR
jgi:hypothetical protein